MSLITETTTSVFDLSEIKIGYLVWAKHESWKRGEAGFVTAATEKKLVVQYQPRIRNVTNHFIVPLSEVEAGEWEIRWSSDLSSVEEYSTDSEEDTEDGTDDTDDTGNTDDTAEETEATDES